MAKPIELEVNGKRYPVNYPADAPLLDVPRDELGLTGSKYGCGEGQYGACTVLIGGAPRRSCQISVSAAAAKPITTIEGLSDDNTHAVQKAWLAEQVPQCGYCQSGQIMAAAALLKKIPNPTDQDIDNAMVGNICRCGTYPRIRKAIKTAAQMMAKASN